MNPLKRFYELMKGTYGSFFPMSKRKREEVLDKVRQKVDYYQPRIEERCQIELGKVEVKDNKEWLSDTLYNSAHKKAINEALKQGRVPTGMDFWTYHSAASMGEMILAVPLFMFNAIRGADMRYHDNTIYMPFNCVNRFMDSNFGGRLKKLDYAVVHELSHGLWDKLSGDKEEKTPFREYRRWFEGFATYGADVFFADFYPKKTEKYSDLKEAYIEGKKKIEELVERYGKEIVLEVPKRWPEFSESF